MPVSTLPSSSQLQGPVRQGANSRVHALQKPYDRPVSVNGGTGIGTGSEGQRASGMVRSGSESSLFGGLKSMLYKPIASLFGTPARPSKKDREDTSSFGDNASVRMRDEDDELELSPTLRRDAKRVRRESPPRGLGRAVTATMVPPTLPPYLNLTPTKRNGTPGPPRSTSTTRGINFSRPLLPTSASMSYLDPPASSLAPSPSRNTPTKRLGGGLARSSARLDLSAMDPPRLPSPGKPRDSWTAWQVDRPPTAASQAGPSTKRTQLNQLPSQSPFSPARSANGLQRSSTTAHLSLGGNPSRSLSSNRSASNFNLASYNTPRERQVSETPSQRTNRDGSVLDWYMSDRWTSIRSHPNREQSVSTTRTQALPTVRKGQMVWDGEAGFVRADRLVPEPTQPLLQNDAERILHALESMRTPLTDARSSLELRKAVPVPLPSARSTSRTPSASASSVNIAPYTRRRQADKAGRSEEGGMRQILARRSAQRVEDDSASAYSKSDASMSGARSESESGRTQASEDEDEMEERSPTPPPARVTRQSKRIQHLSPSPERATPRGKGAATPKGKAAATPKANKGKGKAKAVDVPTITTTSTTPLKSPPKQPVQELPVDSYQPGKVQAGSSLRAKSTSSRQHTPAPTGGASHSSGRFSAREDDLPDVTELEQAAKISLPSFNSVSFGTFGQPAPVEKGKGKEKMTDEIAAEDSSASQELTLASGPETSLMSRLSPGPLAAPAPPAASTASPSKPSMGLRAPGVNSRPRASSPLANHSVVAPPPSPPTTTPAPEASATPAAPFSFGSAPTKPSEGPKKTLGFGVGKPPAPSPAPTASTPGSVPNFFGSSAASAPAPVQPGSNLKFNFAASPSPSPSPAASVPAPAAFNFGSSQPASAAATPVKEAPNPFAGVGTAPTKPVADAPNPFAGVGTSSSSAPAVPAVPAPTPAPAPSAPSGFNFGAPKPVEAPKAPEPAKPTFSFGASSSTSTAPTPAPVPAFGGFGSAPKPADPAPAAPPGFSFGKPAEAPAPAPAPAATSATFSFAKPAAASTASNGFGSTPTPAFGAPASPAASPATFSFGTAPKETATATATAPSFGAPKPATGGFGGTPAANPFGSTPTAPSSAGSTPNGFGAAAPAAPSTGFSFGAPKPASNGFGTASGVTSPVPSSTPAFGFGAAPPTANTGFGAPAPTPSPAPAAGGFSFGAASTQPAAGFGAAAPATRGFGASSAAPASQGFGFGASSPAPAAPTTGFGGFGAPAAPAAPAATGFGFQSPPAAAAATFSFGAPASTTPAAAPAASFSFGAAASGPPRFGSPGPASPAPDGGFNLGAAGETPGSPGGRKIKGLRTRKK